MSERYMKILKTTLFYTGFDVPVKTAERERPRGKSASTFTQNKGNIWNNRSYYFYNEIYTLLYMCKCWTAHLYTHAHICNYSRIHHNMIRKRQGYI